MKSSYQSELSMSCVCLCLSQLEPAGRTLKVKEARLEDSGRYTCLATNAAGEAQQHIRLSVHGNLKIHTALSLHVLVSCLTNCLVRIIYTYFVCQETRWRKKTKRRQNKLLL